jgi:signal transduction histidine kinase/ActR/RegA family two-component response regulator
MEEICAAPESFEQNVNENVRRDGSRVWIAWTNRIVRDERGRVKELLSVGSDITERRRAEEKLRELEKRLLQAQKMEAIGQLAGGVAHDFNNVLAAILGNVQLALADTAEDHAARLSLDEIRKASLRARSLVQQILAFARHRTQERRVMQVGPTIEEAHAFLRATLPASVDLACSMDAATPPVLADATQVYQVVANLCTNAWQAMEGQPGRIEVQLAPLSLDEQAARQIPGLKPGLFACLCVSDTGKGMDAATLERIFEPFFTTKEPGKGTGLGLSVVHGIMQGHEGAITVYSEPGRGTTFKLYFPAAAGPPVAVPAAAAAAVPRRGEGERVLYVDDEEPLVLLATRMLKRLGYRVTAFTRAEEALAAFRQDPASFDLVITDMNMPGLDGIELGKRLLGLRSGLPVVLCSGHVTDELREQARQAGLREVLYKPNSMEEFSEAIHRLASAARPAAELTDRT